VKGLFVKFETGFSVNYGTTRVQEDFSGVTTDAEFMALLDRVYVRRDNELEYGSNVLFRNQVALGYRFSDELSADVYYEHQSHGYILDDDNNDGLDSFGLRVSRKF